MMPGLSAPRWRHIGSSRSRGASLRLGIAPTSSPRLFTPESRIAYKALREKPMWNDYFSYLDYVELRRRVERHLTKAHLLALHISVFIVAVMYVLLMNDRIFSPLEYPDYFTSPSLGSFMTAWSLVLLTHGLLTYRRSAA